MRVLSPPLISFTSPFDSGPPFLMISSITWAISCKILLSVGLSSSNTAPPWIGTSAFNRKSSPATNSKSAIPISYNDVLARDHLTLLSFRAPSCILPAIGSCSSKARSAHKLLPCPSKLGLFPPIWSWSLTMNHPKPPFSLSTVSFEFPRVVSKSRSSEESWRGCESST